MFYLVKTPSLLKKMYSGCTWNLDRDEKVIYLTFDDGPHPVATPFVLDLLKQYNAKATFFCIGKNVVEYPAIYKRTLVEGHATGNHTQNHLHGGRATNEEYVKDIREAKKYIDSNLFRPPYGKISGFQVKMLGKAFKIVMWDVLSGDFDQKIDGAKCGKNVVKNAREGSIVVFHDSQKAFKRLEIALPETLRVFTERGYRFEKIGI